MSNPKNNSTSLLEIELITQVREPRKAKIFLLNDNYTTMDFVVFILQKYFYKSHPEAERIMLNIHENGRGECGVYPAQIAETKIKDVHLQAKAHNFPLKCELEYI